MTELARKTPMKLQEFMDRVDGFINAEDTLRVLTAPRKIELEQAYRKTNVLGWMKAPEKPEKGQHD